MTTQKPSGLLHETQQSFEGFETLATGSSLILIFSNIKKNSSLIFFKCLTLVVIDKIQELSNTSANMVGGATHGLLDDSLKIIRYLMRDIEN
jgi:hypothetical protein